MHLLEKAPERTTARCSKTGDATINQEGANGHRRREITSGMVGSFARSVGGLLKEIEDNPRKRNK